MRGQVKDMYRLKKLPRRSSRPYKTRSQTSLPHLEYGSLGDVQDGNAAGTAYLQIINPETNVAKRERLTRELLAYCKHDTLGMVELVKYLSK